MPDLAAPAVSAGLDDLFAPAAAAAGGGAGAGVVGAVTPPFAKGMFPAAISGDEPLRIACQGAITDFVFKRSDMFSKYYVADDWSNSMERDLGTFINTAFPKFASEEAADNLYKFAWPAAGVPAAAGGDTRSLPERQADTFRSANTDWFRKVLHNRDKLVTVLAPAMPLVRDAATVAGLSTSRKALTPSDTHAISTFTLLDEDLFVRNFGEGTAAYDQVLSWISTVHQRIFSPSSDAVDLNKTSHLWAQNLPEVLHLQFFSGVISRNARSCAAETAILHMMQRILNWRRAKVQGFWTELLRGDPDAATLVQGFTDASILGGPDAEAAKLYQQMGPGDKSDTTMSTFVRNLRKLLGRDVSTEERFFTGATEAHVTTPVDVYLMSLSVAGYYAVACPARRHAATRGLTKLWSLLRAGGHTAREISSLIWGMIAAPELPLEIA